MSARYRHFVTVMVASLFWAVAPAGALGAEVAEINLYSARHYQVDEALFADFTKLTGIEVNRIEGKGDDGALSIDAIADAFWHLHTQHRSAWTQELDLRPFGETF